MTLVAAAGVRRGSFRLGPLSRKRLPVHDLDYRSVRWRVPLQ